MNLPVFANYRDCKLCDLHNHCHTVGIPGRLLALCNVKTDTCVLFVGEAPGANEDREGKCFIGLSGEKLDSFYTHGPDLPSVADIYATNAVRCKPPHEKPSVGSIKACRPYLLDDVAKLSSTYKRVLLICVGSYAVKSVTGRGLTEQFQYPFEKRTEFGPNVYVHATYHPAYLLRKPEQQGVVIQHLSMAYEWLAKGQLPSEEVPDIEYAPICTPENFRRGSMLAFDLETYGILDYGPHQRCYHPIKCELIDGVPKHKMIITIHIAWRDPEGVFHTGYFMDRNTLHRARFHKWLREAGQIGGQNLQFDVKMIRYCHGKHIIPTWKPLRDSMVESFIADDTTPRALKAMTPIYRVIPYDKTHKPVRAFSRPNDPDLIHYGCVDACNSYRIIEKAWSLMRKKYRHHPNAKWKASNRRLKWFSDILWSAILMEERGVTFDTDKLLAAHEDAESILHRASYEAQTKYGYTLNGTGSGKSTRQLFEDCIQELIELLNKRIKTLPDESSEKDALQNDLYSIAGIERTKTGMIKTDKDTRNLLQGIAPPGTKAADALALLSSVSDAKKTTGTYTGPRLFGLEEKRKTIPILVAGVDTVEVSRRKSNIVTYDRRKRLIRKYTKSGEYTGVAKGYPSWYIIPKGEEKGKGGGVRQYRWSAKDPAIQTDPKEIKKCMTSVYRTGVLFAPDYSQIEWRMAAYIAKDKVMLHEIHSGIDPHIETAGILLDINLSDKHEARKWIKHHAIQYLCRSPRYTMREIAQRLAPCKASDYPTEFITEVIEYCRQEAGKSENFAYLFGGTAKVIRATVRIKAGFDIALEKCQDVVNNNNRKYKGLVELRRQLMEMALQDAAIHMPILGLSRTFTDDEYDLRGPLRGQIYDLIIQTFSGQVLQSAVVETQKVLESNKIPAFVCVNNHDSAYIDSRADCFREVAAIAKEKLYDNWFLRQLKDHYGYAFPTKVKVDLLAVRGVSESWAKKVLYT